MYNKIEPNVFLYHSHLLLLMSKPIFLMKKMFSFFNIIYNYFTFCTLKKIYFIRDKTIKCTIYIYLYPYRDLYKKVRFLAVFEKNAIKTNILTNGRFSHP